MIALLQTVFVFGTSLYRYKLSLVLFLFFLAFAPRSLGLPLSGGNFSITFVRMSLPIIIFLYFLMQPSVKWPHLNNIEVLKRERVFQLLVALSLYKILASLLAGVTLLYSIEAFVIGVGCFSLFYILADSDFFDLIVKAITLSCVIIFAAIFVELITGVPLQGQLAGDRYGASERGYRVRAMFDNSLSLAEYLIFCLPWTLFGIVCTRGRQRIGLFVVLGVILFCGLATASRGFLLFGTITVISFFVLFYWWKINVLSRLCLILLVVPISVFVIYFSFYTVAQFLLQTANINYYEIDSHASRSVLSRARQIPIIFGFALESPYFGYGVLQNFANDLIEINIDNYYLRSLLEAGFVGLFLFVLFLYNCFYRVFTFQTNYTTVSQRAYFALAASFLIGFIGAKFFLSMPTNNILFFSLFGLMLGQAKRFGW